MEPHTKTARAHIALAVLYALLFLGFLFLVANGEYDLTHASVLLPLVVFLAVVGAHALAGWGARQRAGWARVLSIVIGALMLFGFPLGTLIGAYLIYNGTRDWALPKAPGPSYADR
ncbi:MAG TPA: hypothetical protein VFQ84_08870 [Arenimonas sp.]|uniref:hypothetical protein n=1 Tax=Arenimonas sp. TaxID=1872635 RepID=UPI002D7FB185|nr:hypothetical protein [Arenimonas sp.]HEU0153442.1 hypothetical protein [Arenimonas sp.]